MVAAGVLLRNTLTVVNVNANCAQLAEYAVYLWHCNRVGNYSLYGSATSESYADTALYPSNAMKAARVSPSSEAIVGDNTAAPIAQQTLTGSPSASYTGGAVIGIARERTCRTARSFPGRRARPGRAPLRGGIRLARAVP